VREDDLEAFAICITHKVYNFDGSSILLRQTNLEIVHLTHAALADINTDLTLYLGDRVNVLWND
jgi:hypothetical protein